MANPTLLTSPIAENGDKNVIPASTGATTGLLDQEHGFQQINELPLQAGGLPPQRKDFNGAFNLLSKILFYVQKGWQFEYDESQDYYAGCVVKDTDGNLYEALNDVSASSTHPKDDTTNWALVPQITSYSLNSNGYVKWSNGFTIQWGMSLIVANANHTDIVFPISFASTNYSIVGMYTVSAAPSNSYGVTLNNLSKTATGCTIYKFPTIAGTSTISYIVAGS